MVGGKQPAVPKVGTMSCILVGAVSVDTQSFPFAGYPVFAKYRDRVVDSDLRRVEVYSLDKRSQDHPCRFAITTPGRMKTKGSGRMGESVFS